MSSHILLNVKIAPDVNGATLKKIIEDIYKVHLAIQSVNIDDSEMTECLSCHGEFKRPADEVINREGLWRGLFCSRACAKNGVKS